MPLRTRPLPWSLVLLLVLLTGACGGRAGAAPAGVTVRLGYFPNLTHAPAIVGVERGIFRARLGPDRLETTTFAAGPAAVEALFSKAVDIAYLGPTPAINAHAKSGGRAIRIIAGATSGGAALVVQPRIEGPEQLRGENIATPQLGGTQDVALRAWLRGNGIRTNTSGGGDAAIVPQENAQTLETFRSGEIAGAWVPEPWATRLVVEGGGRVLVDERSLWPGGEFVTTHVVVRTEFLEEHPDAVRKVLEGHVAANAFISEHGAEAQAVVNDGIERVTSKRIPDHVISAAWANLRFTNDPLPRTLATSARRLRDAGLIEDVELRGIYALEPLRGVLAAAGAEVASP